MLYARTTIRLEPQLKKASYTKALELNLTFQAFVTRALEKYLDQSTTDKARKMIFHSQKLGTKLDKLTREDLYAD